MNKMTTLTEALESDFPTNLNYLLSESVIEENNASADRYITILTGIIKRFTNVFRLLFQHIRLVILKKITTAMDPKIANKYSVLVNSGGDFPSLKPKDSSVYESLVVSVFKSNAEFESISNQLFTEFLSSDKADKSRYIPAITKYLKSIRDMEKISVSLRKTIPNEFRAAYHFLFQFEKAEVKIEWMMTIITTFISNIRRASKENGMILGAIANFFVTATVRSLKTTLESLAIISNNIFRVVKHIMKEK